jgi:hypothetical protein
MATSLTAAAAGLLLGGLAALIWDAASARLGRSDFWPAFSRLARSVIAAADDRDFLRQYGELLKLSMRYVGRNVLLTVASSLPVLLCVWLLAPPALERYREGRARTIDPAQRPTLSIAGEKPPKDRDGERMTFIPTLPAPVTGVAEPGGFTISVPEPEFSFYTALGLGSVTAMIVLWKRR